MRTLKPFSELELSDAFMFAAAMEVRYMVYGGIMYEMRHEGRIEGLQEGQTQAITLVNAMLADGKIEEVKHLQSDPEFLRQMLEQYNLV